MRSLVGKEASWIFLLPTAGRPLRHCIRANVLPNYNIFFAEPLLLRRFYQCMYGDVEETKKLIEVNYALRNKHPHLFIKRDPLDEDSRRTFDYA